VIVLMLLSKYLGSIIVSALTSALLLYDLLDVNRNISDLDEEFARGSVGWGLWLATAGAIVAFGTSIALRQAASPGRPWRRMLQRIQGIQGTASTLYATGAVFVIALVLLLRRSYLSDDISPFDEGSHLSYLQYVHGWYLPRTGDALGSWAEQAYACRLSYPYGEVTQVPCGVDGPSSAYPQGGQNTAAVWPPMYFIVVAQLMRPLLLIGMEPLLAGRTVSALFWALGSAALAYIVIRLSDDRLLGISAGVLGATMPAVWMLSSYVSPHSTVMLVGVGLLLLLLWGARTARPTWHVALVSVGAAVVTQLTLPHSIVALCAISVAAITLAWSRPPDRIRLLTLALTLLGAGVLTFRGWARIVSLRAVGEGPIQPSTPPEGLRVAIIDNWSLFWPRALAEIQFLSDVEGQIALLISYGSIALIGYWILSERASEQRSVALGVAIAAPVASVAFALLLDFWLPSRYGTSIFPLILVLLAIPAASRAVRTGAFLLAGVCAIASFASAGSFMVIR
jgi:hypothetical protein